MENITLIPSKYVVPFKLLQVKVSLMKSTKATSNFTIIKIPLLSNVRLILVILDAYLLFYSLLQFMEETKSNKHLPPLFQVKKKQQTMPNVPERPNQIAPSIYISGSLIKINGHIYILISIKFDTKHSSCSRVDYRS